MGPEKEMLYENYFCAISKEFLTKLSLVKVVVNS